MRPHVRKVRAFERSFPHPLTHNEWQVKLKVYGCEWKTYNPDYWCEKLGCFIEVATSKPNISDSKIQWVQAIKKHRVRVFWWEGMEITDILLQNGYFGFLP